MAGRILLDACNPALDSNGAPDADATLTFYENGTTTLQSIYDGADLLTPLSNPLSPNAAGQFPQIWGADLSTYSVKWTAGDGTEVTFDDIGTVNNLVTASNSIFSAQNAANQTATGTLAKITFGTESLDPLSCFANSRHTPNAPGWYRYDTNCAFDASGGITGAESAFYKNGAVHQYAARVNGLDASGSVLTISGGVTVYMNGTTDYMEVYGRVFGTGTLLFVGTSPNICTFEGKFVHA